EILRGDGRVLIRRRERRVVRPKKRDHRMPELGKRHVEPARLIALAHVATPLAAGTDADHVHRAMAHAVIAIAREVLRGELPVARDQPLVDAADGLRPTLASVPAVEQEIEVELVAADVVQERRARAVPGRPDRTLVAGALGDLDESPARAIQLLAVRVFRER